MAQTDKPSRAREDNDAATKAPAPAAKASSSSVDAVGQAKTRAERLEAKLKDLRKSDPFSYPMF